MYSTTRRLLDVLDQSVAEIVDPDDLPAFAAVVSEEEPGPPEQEAESEPRRRYVSANDDGLFVGLGLDSRTPSHGVGDRLGQETGLIDFGVRLATRHVAPARSCS